MNIDAAPRLPRVLLLALVWGWASTVTAAESAAQRLVSLAPSVTEVLFEAGLGPRVVGVTSYCRFPREVLAIPKVGGYLTPSFEALVALRPDLAVVLPEHVDLESRLAALRIPILRLDHRSLDGIVRSIVVLGERCGVQPRAERAAEALRQHLARVQQIRRGASRPRVLVCFGRSEDFRRLYAAAPGTVHDDLIRQAGGENALTSRAVSYPIVSVEGLMRLDPDVIVEFAPGRPDAATLRRQWNALDAIRAVKSGRIYVFTDDFLSVPGPRFVRFAETIARVLFPR